MPVSVKVTIEGEEELNRLLDSMSGPQLKKVAGKATASAAVKVLKPVVKQRAAFNPALARSIRAGAARKDKPAGIVHRDHKRAWWGHFVVGGTKPHRIRFPDQKAAGVPKEQGNIRHPGIVARPIFDEAEQSHGGRVVDFVADVLKDQYDLD